MYLGHHNRMLYILLIVLFVENFVNTYKNNYFNPVLPYFKVCVTKNNYYDPMHICILISHMYRLYVSYMALCSPFRSLIRVITNIQNCYISF